MTDIKSGLGIYGDPDLAGERALGKRTGVFVHEHLSDVAELVDEAGDAGVGGADHRESRFDATKDGVREMLTRTGRPEKPTVVGDIDEKIGAGQNELAREIANRVLEANERRDLRLVAGQFEHREFFSERKIIRDLVADHARQTWNRVAAGNVSTEWHEADLPIHLQMRGAIGNNERGVVRVLFVPIDR